MRKAKNLKVQAIQKEQYQLVQIEKSLETLLGNINESINSLKVEELQLKSSLVEHFTSAANQNEEREREEKPTTSAHAASACFPIDDPTMWPPTADNVLQPVSIDGFLDEGINKQLLNLETLLVPMKKRALSGNEEDDEDEEEMDAQETASEESDDEEFLPE